MNKRHRAPIERIFKIIQMAKKGGKLNASTIAAMFEVDRKTIQRDITFIRDRLSVPITYNPQKHSIEERPKASKTGGVYYSPSSVVEYIKLS